MALGHWLKDYIGPHSGGSGGSGGGGTEPLIIRYDRTEVSGSNTYMHYFDKTWQEVADALTNFAPVYIHGFDAYTEYSENPLSVYIISEAMQDGDYFTASISGDASGVLVADSADGALYFKYEDEG